MLPAVDKPPAGESWLGNPKGGRVVGSGLWTGCDHYVFVVGYCDWRVEIMGGVALVGKVGDILFP